jgi:integration host factor subunit beta
LIKETHSLNKIDLIHELQTQANLTKIEAADVVNLFFETITDALENGDRVEIRGLCSFYVKKYDSYTGRNPKTGEHVQIPAKRLPFFKCGKELKEMVDYKLKNDTLFATIIK